MRYSLCIIIIFGFSSCQITFAQNVSDYYDSGVQYFNSSNYSKAVIEFDKAIKLDPNYVDAYIYRGTAKDKLSLYDEAIQDYSIAIGLNPANPLAYYNRGYVKFELGLNQDAISDFNKTIKLNPFFVDAYINRGRVEYSLGLYEEAIKDYDKTIELAPDNCWAYINKGIIYYISGLYKKSIQEYNKGIENDPANSIAYYNRGLAKSELGLYQEAMDDFTKTLELDPEYKEAQTALNKLKNRIAPDLIQKPKIWAVAVGLSIYKYEGLMTSLNSPVKNVYDFARFMESINFINDKIPILINSAAKKDDILQTLKSTFLNRDKVNENDMIIFYYSGHGVAVGDESGICPYDYINPQQLITDKEILDILQKSPARHKVCIIEACKTEAKSLSPLSESSFNHFNEERKKIPGSIVYITSTEVGKESIEVAPVGTVFSYYLLKGITEGEADWNKDGIIRVKELYDYVKANVIKYTGNIQIPQINQEGYDSDIPILVYK